MMMMNPLANARRKRKSNTEAINNCNNKTQTQEGSGEEEIKKKIKTKQKAAIVGDTKAKELWFKKSGAGKKLFVSYYSQQPFGVICEENEHLNNDEKEIVELSDKSQDRRQVCCQQRKREIQEMDKHERQGNSRAAKRRWKRKCAENQSNRTQNHVEKEEQQRGQSCSSMLPMEKKNQGHSNGSLKIEQKEQTYLPNSLLHYFYQSINANIKNKVTNMNKSQHLESFFLSLSTPLPLTIRFRNVSTVQQERNRSIIKELSTIYDHLVQRVVFSSSLSVTNSISNSSTTKTLSHHNTDKVNNCESPQLKDIMNEKSIIYQSLPTIQQPNKVTDRQQTISQLNKFNLRSLSPGLHQLIQQHSNDGTIARQELGSMLPVLALHSTGCIGAGSKVLDLCASPGSKTLQTLEIVSSNAYNSSNNHGTSVKDLHGVDIDNTDKNNGHKFRLGRVVANDIHPKRLLTLQESVRRSGMPESILKRIVYTNHDATCFPFPKSSNDSKNSFPSTLKNRSKMKKIHKPFDCIIADVPCSGDGTIRKDGRILPSWTPSIGNSLHSTQLKILKRALILVKTGGVVCYSTCSFNPVENEAVVASALKWSNSKQNSDNDNSDQSCDDHISKDISSADKKDFVELLEWPSNVLPGLRRRPGVNNWLVAEYNDNDNHYSNENKVEKGRIEKGAKSLKYEDKADMDEEPSLTWYPTFRDALEQHMPCALESLWPPTVTPSTKSDCSPRFEQNQKQKTFDLTRCNRLWPQDHDTGTRYCGKDPIKSLELARDTVTGFGNKHRTLPYN